MKWLVLLAFIAIAGGWASYLQSDKRALAQTGMLLGFLTFTVAAWHLVIAPFAIPMWGGHTKGWEVTLLDSIAVACLIAKRGVGSRTPMLVPLLCYFLINLLCVFEAQFPTFALAYPIQLFRVMLLFAAASRIASYPGGAKAIYAGLVLGLLLQCGYAVSARLGGAIQTGGTFGHQNLLGFVSHMVLLPSFALVLGKRWLGWSVTGLAAGVIVVILTASRATIVIAGVGIVLTYLVASAARWNERKGVFGLITIAMLAVAVPLASNSLERRYAAQGGGGTLFAEDQERDAFERAAKMMISDHPFGVGPNHYVYMANTRGYNEKANVTWASTSRATNVHNSYLLVTAETGYLGFLAFAGMLATITIVCIRSAFRYKASPYSELLAGIGCGIVAVALHCKYEWMVVTFQAQYVFGVVVGLASGCLRQLEASRAVRPKRKIRSEPSEQGALANSDPIDRPELQARPI